MSRSRSFSARPASNRAMKYWTRLGSAAVHRRPNFTVTACAVFGLIAAGCSTAANGGGGTAGAPGIGTNSGPQLNAGGALATAGSPVGASGTSGPLAGAAGTSPLGAGTAGASGAAQAGSAGIRAGAGGATPTETAGSAGSAAVLPTGPNTNSGFVNLAPPFGAPLDGKGTMASSTPPAGWVWYQIEGAVCRDGSPTGFYVRNGTADKLLIYLEGGGACSSPGFCSYNPANVNQVLNGDGQTVAGSIGGAVAGHQQPGTAGIFDMTQAANPFKDWSEIYIPYCTGDVHFGTRKDVMLPGVNSAQQFVGYFNMQKFIGRIVPTFKDKVSRVVLTGASAGGFGALLNYSMVQDAFGSVLVTVLNDSAPSFADSDKSMPVCLQKSWREIWGLNAAMPSDCTECLQADGGGLNKLATFLFRKHPNATIGVVSSMQDEVIRLFYSSGLKNCSSFATADPVSITLGQSDATVYMPGADYTAGLTGLRMSGMSTGKVATYFLGGTNISFHQHVWRQRFYDASAGSETIAAWTTNLLAGKLEQVGP
jgi:hypothetical protein